MGIEPNLHPVFVHFTVALVLVATACALASKVLKGSHAEHSVIVARWLFLIAALLTVLTVAAGIYAFNTVNHDDQSHEVMLEHRTLALIAFALILVTAILFYLKRKETVVSILALLFALGASGMVLSAAWHGGELVYEFGLGVKSLPKPHAGHSHSHDATDSGDSGHTHSDAGAQDSGHTHNESEENTGHEHNPADSTGTEHTHGDEETGHTHSDSVGGSMNTENKDSHEHNESSGEHSHAPDK